MFESFSYATGVGGEQREIGVVGWCQRGDNQGGSPVKWRKSTPPPIIEDQERLGCLYSMIARR